MAALLQRARERGSAAFQRAAGWVRQPGVPRTLAPLILAVLMAPWLYFCRDNYIHGLLYRDSTMFLYVAWCVRHGERLYDTVAMPDGPFACVIHMVLQFFGHTNDDGAFRLADLGLHAIGGGVASALLVPRRARHRWTSLLVWTVVGSAVWVAAMFHWGFASSSQREAYYALFTFVGLAFWLASVEYERRASNVALLLGGFFVALPVFGKPTCALFVLAGLVGLAFEPPDEKHSRKRRLAMASAGLGAGAVAMLGFVALFGSMRGYWFWSFDYVSTYYRFHDYLKVAEIAPIMLRDVTTPALATMLVGTLAVALGFMPRRSLGLALTPALALGVVFVQHKGWKYHYIPASMMTAAFMLLLVIRAWHHEPACRSAVVGPVGGALLLVRAPDA